MSDDLTALETEVDEAQAALAQLHNTGSSSPALLAEAEARVQAAQADLQAAEPVPEAGV